MNQAAQKQFYRRRQFLINKGFQHRVIWRFVAVAVLSIFASHLVTIGYFKFKEMIAPTSQDLMYFASSIQETLQFSRVLEILWVPLLLSAVLGSLFVLIFALMYSHRIAGPLFNLKRMMNLVGEGKLNVTMHIRKTDELHDVEEEFNKMIRGLNQHLEGIKTAVNKLSEPNRKLMIKVLRDLNMLDGND